MTKHDTMRLRLVAAVVVASACAIVPAAATPPVGLTFELLAGPIVFAPWDVNVSPIDKNVKWDMKLSSRSDSDIYIVRNTVAPGGNLGWHTHPGPTMVSVIEGAVLLYDGTDPLCGFRRYEAGEGFTEISREHVHNLRNASGEAQARVIAYHMLPRGEPRRIDKPKPTNCPAF